MRRIAVFLPNWVGDVVMATPAVRALRERFRDAAVTYVGRPAALATIGGAEPPDPVIVDRSAERPRWASFLALAAAVRRGQFDLAVLLPNSFRTALAARLAGVRRIAGYARDGRGWLLMEKLQPPRGPDGRFAPIPALDYYAALVGLLGAVCRDRRLALPVAAADAAAAERLLAEAGLLPKRTRKPLVMLNPGSSFGPSKMWDPRRFAALADLLVQRRGAGIIINAAPAERLVAAEAAEAMRHPATLNLARHANSIGLVKALLRRCDLLVTNDTGARHLAAAMGTGVVTLFGSTDPEWSRIDYTRERIVRVEVECSPCQKKLCQQPAGPFYHQCMERISPEVVLAAAEELLDAGRGAGARRRRASRDGIGAGGAAEGAR